MRPRLATRWLALAAAATTLPLAQALPQLGTDQTVLLAPPNQPGNALETEHSIHSLAALPSHRIRLRSPRTLCDPSVGQTSGYLDTARGHHFFFWQFDSRNDPKRDPLVLWYAGQTLFPCSAAQC